MTPQTIRAARVGMNWTQQKLASEAGIHAKSVARWERQMPFDEQGAVETIAKMQAAFARHGVTITDQSVTFPKDQ